MVPQARVHTCWGPIPDVRVKHERVLLWMAMAEYTVPTDLQIATKSTYKTTKSRVSTNIGSGEWLTTESGVRQGSIPSPILSVMYMDLVIKEVHQNNPDNDFVLAYKKLCRRYCANGNLYRNTLEEYRLNQSQSLNTWDVGPTAKCRLEINSRILKMSQNVGMMYRLLKDRHVPNKAKLLIHMTILRPILLYGHESWILTKKLKSKITAADMKVLRLVKGITRRDRLRNADIYEEVKIKPIIETIQTDLLRWFGHVMRRDEKTTAKKVLDLNINGKIPRERPRTSWLKKIYRQHSEGNGNELKITIR